MMSRAGHYAMMHAEGVHAQSGRCKYNYAMIPTHPRGNLLKQIVQRSGHLVYRLPRSTRRRAHI